MFKYITNDTVIPITWVSEWDEGFLRELRRIERETEHCIGLLIRGLFGGGKVGL